MVDRPIIFSAAMVRAIIDGRKSQTRRVLKPQPSSIPAVQRGETLPPEIKRWPYAPGDRLWVREAFRGARGYERQPPTRWGNKPIWYVADGQPPDARWSYLSAKAHPSIHMPRWASRLTLTVTGVKVERLQDISENDAIAEGIITEKVGDLRRGGFLDERDGPCTAGDDTPVYFAPDDDDDSCAQPTPQLAFERLWNLVHDGSVYGEAWAANPWVVAVTFTVREGNIDK